MHVAAAAWPSMQLRVDPRIVNRQGIQLGAARAFYALAGGR